MRTLAWHCAPHLALKLPEETPLRFSRPLPVSSRMRAKGLDVSDPERLVRAKLKLGRLAAGRPGPGHKTPGPALGPSAPTMAAGSVTSSGRQASLGEKGDRDTTNGSILTQT